MSKTEDIDEEFEDYRGKKKLLDQLIKSQWTQEYLPVAIDASNIYADIINESQMFYKLKSIANRPVGNFQTPQFRDQALMYFNKVIIKFFQVIYQLVKYSDLQQEDCFVVFDGRKAQFKRTKKTMFNQDGEQYRGKQPSKWYIEYVKIWEQMRMKMKFVMISNLDAAGVKVIVAPYQADHQIVRMFNQEEIRSVFSNDYGYFFYGVPIIKDVYSRGRQCKVIDVDQYQGNQIIKPPQFKAFVQSVQQDKRNHNDFVKKKIRQKKLLLGVMCNYTIKKKLHIQIQTTLKLFSQNSSLWKLNFFFHYAWDKHKIHTKKQCQQAAIEFLYYSKYASVWNPTQNNDEGGQVFLYGFQNAYQKDKMQKKCFCPLYGFDRYMYQGKRDTKHVWIVNQQKPKIKKSTKDPIQMLLVIKNWMNGTDQLNNPESDSDDESLNDQKYFCDCQKCVEKNITEILSTVEKICQKTNDKK